MELPWERNHKGRRHQRLLEFVSICPRITTMGFGRDDTMPVLSVGEELGQ